jgi:hypothetical protein
VTDEEWDLVPLDTIRDGLARRFDSIVIVGCRDEGPEGSSYSIRYVGRHLECIGLAQQAALDISDDFTANQEDRAS